MERLARSVGGRKPYAELSSRQKSTIARKIRQQFRKPSRTDPHDVDVEHNNSEIILGSRSVTSSERSPSLNGGPLNSLHDDNPSMLLDPRKLNDHNTLRQEENTSQPIVMLQREDFDNSECYEYTPRPIDMMERDDHDRTAHYENNSLPTDMFEPDNRDSSSYNENASMPTGNSKRDNTNNNSDHDNHSKRVGEECDLDFRCKLASCFVDNRISLQASDRILAVLRTHPCFSSLPKSSKTLLNTPTKQQTLLEVPPGEYLHIGFEVAIRRILMRASHDHLHTLEIDFSTDGAALDSSGLHQMWPLQCRVANIERSSTEVIGIYKGPKKPNSAMDFFRPFVEEANNIIRNYGITFFGKKMQITLRAFIADAPARAFVLNHMGHNSTWPCSKCTVEGESVNRRMTYPGVNDALRTNEEYHMAVDKSHHKEGQSPLSLLPFSVVSQVPFEYMHLVLLGVMKRLLTAWVDGMFSKKTKLCSRKINLASARIERLANNCPSEFSRRLRSLNFYGRYKATELRQILLYVGPNIFEGILDDVTWNHFVLLHVSMRILTFPNLSKQILSVVREYLKKFVNECQSIYGVEFISYNVHGLLHIVDDVELLGPIDNYSAFPYENNMQIFRQYCRKPELILQQFANRRAEENQWKSKETKVSRLAVAEPMKKCITGLLPAGVDGSHITHYRKIKFPNFILDINERDSCCIMKDGSICLVYNVVSRNANLYLVVKRFTTVTSFSNYVENSASIGHYKCSKLSEEFTLVTSDNVLTKGYCMPHCSPFRFNDSGEELFVSGEFIVVSMLSHVYYS